MVEAAPGMKGKLTFSPLDRSIGRVYKREEVTQDSRGVVSRAGMDPGPPAPRL